jgi:hypothetical protein
MGHTSPDHTGLPPRLRSSAIAPPVGSIPRSIVPGFNSNTARNLRCGNYLGNFMSLPIRNLGNLVIFTLCSYSVPEPPTCQPAGLTQLLVPSCCF